MASLTNQTNLTQSQFLLWMGQQINPDFPVYNMTHAYKIMGEIDPVALDQAFQKVVASSDALRSVVRVEDGVPQRQENLSINGKVELFDFSESADPDQAYQKWVDERITRILDLENQLFDTALIKLAQDRWIWYLNQHHVITDAIATGLVYQATAEFYDLAVVGKLDESPALPQFSTFVESEEDHKQSDRYKNAVDYWAEKISGEPSELNFYGKKVPEKAGAAKRVELPLGAERSAKLKDIAMEDGFASLSMDMSLSTLFGSVLATTIHRITGEKQIRIGTPYHGRQSAAFKKTIGVFIEIGMMQVDIEENDTFATLGEKVLDETFTNMMQIQPGISTPELNQSFNVILNYINGTSGDFGGHNVSTDWIHSGYCDANQAFRLQITDFDQTGELTCLFDMATSVFGPAESEWLTEQFLVVIDQLIADHTQPIGGFSLLTSEQHQSHFVEFNQTDTEYPSDKTVVDLFAEQVTKQPDAIAAQRGDATLTYAELNQRSNQLANQLTQLGAKPETTVAICMQRSLEVLVAIWGVLKSGAAYVPIDPSYPAERRNMMLADAKPLAVLVNSPEIAEIVETDQPIIVVDSTAPIETKLTPNHHPLTTNSLAYMIYTSGSTGTPKGTMLTHQGLTNYAVWAQKVYQNGEIFDFPLYSSLAFDLTVTSVFVPLISGGRVVVYSEADHGRGLEVLAVVQDDLVDLVKLTPAHLDLVTEHLGSTERIKALIVGGEDFKTDLANSVLNAFGREVAIFNEYGPTEAVVGCMIHKFDPEQDRALSVPIGTPAANARIYILDEYRQPVPLGVEGEMFISSDGVARGYRNRPELTAERFTDDPFRKGARMYQAGDIAKWGADGRLIFLGRRDNQVKIRGARIELGEIQAALLEHPAIESVIVDVVQKEVKHTPAADIDYCVTCGLPSNYPTAELDDELVCSDCRAYARYESEVQRYFKTPDDLHQTLDEVKAEHAEKKYDTIVLLSGGKDSTYMLYQLVREFGLRPLAFTLDNGFISPEAIENSQKACNDLGVDLKIASTPHMNAIFADSLQRKSNVCDGCFKTIYTLSMSLARSLGINTIVTGLARGQLFETRLADTFKMREFDPEKIDNLIIDARKAYHHIDDAVYQLLDTDLFQNDKVFGEITFVDFYRYVDVDLDTVYDYLTHQTIWERPSDTGRSTNCLINDVGIYIHNKEQGYHNYALPYSWDVRLGHKHREAAMDELDDDLNLEDIRKILDKIGYDENAKLAEQSQKRIAVWHVANSELPMSELRDWLAERIPDYMLPSYFTQLDKIPLTTNGKIDRKALPDPTQGGLSLTAEYIEAESELEVQLTDIWQSLLEHPKIGIHHDFFDLGGDSVSAIQTITHINQFYEIEFPIPRFFDSPTISGLAEVIEEILMAEIDDLDDEEILKLLAEE